MLLYHTQRTATHTPGTAAPHARKNAGTRIPVANTAQQATQENKFKFSNNVHCCERMNDTVITFKKLLKYIQLIAEEYLYNNY